MASASSSSSRGGTGSAGGGSNSRNRRRNTRVQCTCERRCGIFFSSKPGPNFGRRFYGCENWNNQDPLRGSCKYFKWFDVSPSPESLQQERDALEQGIEVIEDELWAVNQEFVCVSQERDELRVEVGFLKKELENRSSASNVALKAEIAVLYKFVCVLVVLLMALIWRISS